jgi:hypothetical protein
MGEQVMGYRTTELGQLVAAVRTEAARLEQELTLLSESSRPVYASVLGLYQLGMAPLDVPGQLEALLHEEPDWLPGDVREQLHAIRDQWAGHLSHQLQLLQSAERAVEASYGAQAAKQLADLYGQMRPPFASGG